MFMYSWNPVFNMVMEMKYSFSREILVIDQSLKEQNILGYWASKLNSEKYSDFLKCLTINQHNKLVLIKVIYESAIDELWFNPESIYRECNGVIIDLENDEIVLSSFAKIFNMDEVYETRIGVLRDEIDDASLFEVTEKLDGSLQNARAYRGEIIMSDSTSFDVYENPRLMDGYRMMTDAHKRMILQNTYYTFSFEYVSEKYKKIASYAFNDLILIGIRDIVTGRQLPYREIKNFANNYRISMSRIEEKSLDEILLERFEYTSLQREGWMINVSKDGLNSKLVKIKVSDYVTIPNSIEEAVSVDCVMRNFNKFDDFVCRIPYEYQKQCFTIYKKLAKLYIMLNTEIKLYYSKFLSLDSTDYNAWIKNNVPIHLQECVIKKVNRENIDLFENIDVLKASRELLTAIPD